MSALLIIFASMLLAWNVVEQPTWCKEFWTWMTTFWNTETPKKKKKKVEETA